MEAADGVAAADLNGDGADELIFVLGTVARWPGGGMDLGGALQATARGDLDDDGREEAYLATGMNRDNLEAPARVWRIDAAGLAKLWEHQGARNQVTDLRIEDGRVWLAAFTDRTHVVGGWLDGPEHREMVKEKLATRHVPLGPDAVAVGRIYGEKPKSDGDLRIFSKAAGPVTLPTLRGVRSLAAADLDGDGARELLVGDGWHYAYGAQGVARVRLLEAPDYQTGRVIGAFDGEYTVREIQVMGGDVLAVGSGAVHLLRRDDLGWSDRVLAPIDETKNAALVRTPSGPAALIAGDPSLLVRF